MIYLNIQMAPPTRDNTGSNHIEEEATWEQDEYIRTEFPDLFSS